MDPHYRITISNKLLSLPHMVSTHGPCLVIKLRRWVPNQEDIHIDYCMHLTLILQPLHYGIPILHESSCERLMPCLDIGSR
jgi:hypothetical protein